MIFREVELTRLLGTQKPCGIIATQNVIELKRRRRLIGLAAGAKEQHTKGDAGVETYT